ncbi:unnamed protein product [Rotaria sordida]|uniref:GP-PDE domain-containing protein n=1 Tax=Rotaria sordida TaxID=392033 RepID=A0A815J920_9BILA|nr:unnamed protein product [Rotaria sordida]CAF4009970.1 unnamed protein product [Rotaria sordida]
MLRLRQTLFPVLFLTQGEKGDWPQFLDVRTWSINIGLYFVITEYLSSLAAPALDILSNKEFVKQVKDNGKLLFIWSDEASDKEVSKCLLELRVDGLIFDHIAELKDEHSTTENSFMSEEREELEVLNNFQLERLKTARQKTNSPILSPTNQISKTSTNFGQDQLLIIDTNFKHLILPIHLDEKSWYILFGFMTFIIDYILSRCITLQDADNDPIYQRTRLYSM